MRVICIRSCKNEDIKCCWNLSLLSVHKIGSVHARDLRRGDSRRRQARGLGAGIVLPDEVCDYPLEAVSRTVVPSLH
jgi:hypothetical protein